MTTDPHLTADERAMLADLEVTHGADVATAQLLVLDAYRHGRSDALRLHAQPAPLDVSAVTAAQWGKTSAELDADRRAVLAAGGGA